MDTPAVKGALKAVELLVSLFQGRVHLVSKAGPKISALTREWLAGNHFVGPRTFSMSNVHFVRKRPDKALVCRQLSVTHFVDDRVDVLEHLPEVRYRYHFVGGLGRHSAPPTVDCPWIQVSTWEDLVELISGTVSGA